MAPPVDHADGSRPALPRGLLAGALVLSVAAHLVVLYWPSPGGSPMFPGADKIVHVLVFAAPALLGLLLTRRPAPVLGLLALHAPVSELVQGALLAGRSGDWRDLLADLAGVLLGWVVWRGLRRW
ncbi:VanZ family protein [Actinomycetota bacterium]